jgi:hypothetical protein
MTERYRSGTGSGDEFTGGESSVSPTATDDTARRSTMTVAPVFGGAED